MANDRSIDRLRQRRSLFSIWQLQLVLVLLVVENCSAFGGQHDRGRNLQIKSVGELRPRLAAEQPAEVAGLDLFGVCTTEKNREGDYLAQLQFNGNQTKFPESANQIKAIRSEAPAVLLKSGPGTGKSHALASRIAYLLNSYACDPQHMVVLSFTNRDAESLKSKALDMMFAENTMDYNWFSALSGSNHRRGSSADRELVSQRLWGGTIHSFASKIIKAYGPKNIRVVSSREIKQRTDTCLRRLLDPRTYETKGEQGTEDLRTARRIHKEALEQARQSRGVIIHQIVRCIELWKESAMIPPTRVNGIKDIWNKGKATGMELRCMKVAMRLGVFSNIARLAWKTLPLYAELHEISGTIDPSDLSPLAHNLLESKPRKLGELRNTLKHIVLDEYQDVSVAQHALIRLVVCGTTPTETKTDENLPPVLDVSKPSVPSKERVSFNVPRLFSAGDSNQSIYGWRGAAPILSVEGFTKDYPQGVVVPLDTNFRVPSSTWSALETLIDQRGDSQTFSKSPVFAAREKEIATGAVAESSAGSDVTETLLQITTNSSMDASSIHIQGLWDGREEARDIASRIRRKSKERTEQLTATMKKISGSQPSVPIRDPTEVAVLVRGSNHIELIQEALHGAGVPYVVCEGEESAQASNKPVKPIDMKPVTIMTMHRAKGEEFDEVYLPFWTEGVFPHPSAVSTNRVDEERRLAYVAISRARQLVEITHSFVKRTLCPGPQGQEKHVTEQVRASRFIYELVPEGSTTTKTTATAKSGSVSTPTVVWHRGRGSKGSIAGSNLPSEFQESYAAPKDYSSRDKLDEEARKWEEKLLCTKTKTPPPPKEPKRQPERSGGIATTFDHLTELLNQKGRKQNTKKYFKKVLSENFGIQRGRAPVFGCEDEIATWDTVTHDKLKGLEFQPDGSRDLALSKCSALQLGLYIVYLFNQDRL